MQNPSSDEYFFGLSGNEIYKKYFREGLYTHLCLYPVKSLENGAKDVKWKYVFVDMGMQFEIERHFIVWGDETVLDVHTGRLAVAGDLGDLRDKLYDHYRPYVSELYDKLGLRINVI